MRTMHLFAGAGGGLLADRILGHTPVVAVEWEPYACQVLRERAADGWFPELVVWEGDVREFDPSEYTGRVDCIHAGFPCQDISQAGKQAGVGEGTRSGLYREVLRIAGIVRPRSIFLENVAAIKSNGLETVLKDLALLGYDTKWLCIRASDVGAPHHRDRWFALATNSNKNRQSVSTINAEASRMPQSDVAHSNGEHGQWRVESQQSSSGCWETRGESCRGGENVAHADSTQRQGNECASGSISQHSNTSGSGWWETEPPAGRVADGVAFRVQRLKALGNGQVPLQVAVAFTILAAG